MTLKQIAIVSAAIALVGVGVSASGFFKPPQIQQKSSGSDSPNIGSVGGNLEINN